MTYRHWACAEQRRIVELHGYSLYGDIGETSRVEVEVVLVGEAP